MDKIGFSLLIIIVLSLGGCGRVQNERFTGAGDALPEGVTVSVVVSGAGSLHVGTPAEALISVTEDGAPVTGAILTVEGNMTHAGMEPIFSTVTESAPGDYRAPLNWTMGGDWIITVRGTLPDGRTVEQRVEGLTVES